MIVSISRRTDLPALYPDWLMNRLREGFVLVRQPYRPHRISRVELRPEKAECLVFWSKIPRRCCPAWRKSAGWAIIFISSSP